MFVLDSHCDTPSQILRGRDLAKDNELAHIDIPKLKRGGVDAAFFALYIPADLEEEEAYEYACRLYRCVTEMIEANSDHVALATSQKEAYENRAKGKFSVFLGLENGSAIGNSSERLKEFHNWGVRYITLCHSKDNQICDSCAGDNTWGGLSPFGREIVSEMNSLDILVDVSHLSDASFYDVLKYSSKPVVATHSCCRALSDHPRNMTDDMIRALAEKDGVIQINFYPLFLDVRFNDVLSASGLVESGDAIEAEFIADPLNENKRNAWLEILSKLQQLPRPSYTMIADHIDHVVGLVGIDHVGLGSDFDGIGVTPEGMEDASRVPELFDELRKRGYSDSDLEKIASANFFSVLSC